MNGPIKMYQARQIVRYDMPIELPKCMYALKNIHSTRNGVIDSSVHVSSSDKKLDIFDQVKQFLKNNHKIPGMAELEAKQEDILKQLAELKEQILSIKSDLKTAVIPPKKPAVTFTAASCREVTVGELPDIIINASPVNPPYSLEFVQKLLQNTVNLIFSIHLHSTINSLPKEARTLEEKLLNFTPKSDTPEVKVRLIWKNINSNTELLVSHIPILGEINLLRYLTRALRSPLSYESEPDCIEIDSILDICYLIVRARTKSERTNLLQTLNKSLGKSQWMLGRCQTSVVDIAAYSAIKQASNTSEISANLGKWFQRCETIC